ncbi:MAG: alkylmercury lyase family protein [Blastocatellia bacterium]|nr:alkylmercury lyase family protein [Blastocatellia bacterium]
MNQIAPQIPVHPHASRRMERMLESLCALRAMAEKLASLTPEEDSVRRFILNAYPELGRAPERREIESAFPQYTGEQIDRVCRRLHELDIIYISKESNEKEDFLISIAGAYPFTDLRDDHSVKFQWQEEQRSVYAMCAIDALGIPFMLNADAEIRSSCGRCETAINLSVRDEAITAAEPPSAVVFVGLSCTGHAATSLCTALLFFCCEAHAEAWRGAHENPAGETLTLGESLALGKELFGNRLQPSDFWKQQQRTRQ